jgi:hypothetical protein
VLSTRLVNTAFLAPRTSLVPELDGGTIEEVAAKAMESLMAYQAEQAVAVAPDLDLS